MSSGRPAPPTLFSQIARRLAVVALLFGVLNAIIVVASYALDQQEMSEDLVGGQAERLSRAWRAQGAQGGPLAPPLGVSRWSYRLVNAEGRTLLASADGPVLVPERDLLDSTRRDRIAGGVRISGVRQVGDGQWAIVSTDTQGFRAFLPVIAGELADHVLLPLLPLTLLLIVFSLGVARRVLAPLATAAAEVDRLDPARMEARLSEPAASREVSVFVAAVNRALARLDHAMTLLRDFTADAAHELRTPLSVLQLRLHDLPEGEAKQRLREDLRAMARLVNQLLDLSQADALQMDGATDLDLRGLAQEVIAQTAPLAFAEDRDLRLIDLGPAPIRGHAEALGRALRNLVENAIRHGGGLGDVEVTVGPGPRLAVRDHGPGLGSIDPELVFRRFWKQRRDGSGAGLGLGIARSIVEAHGGVIRARDAEGGGALFECDFSAAGAPAPDRSEA